MKLYVHILKYSLSALTCTCNEDIADNCTCSDDPSGPIIQWYIIIHKELRNGRYMYINYVC